MLIICWSLISIVLFGIIAYGIDRAQSVLLISSWLLLFTGYFLIIRRKWDDQELKKLLAIAFIFRLVFLVSLPALSDDYFRFIWDGQLSASGINPFLFTPGEIIDFNPELYGRLNSQNYYSVYPPVMQGVFYITGLFTSSNTIAPVVLMRCAIILAEAGTIYFLLKILGISGKNKSRVLLYALNPLIIIELTGNLHFEGIMLFFLIAAFYLLMKKLMILSAIFFSLAVCTKLIPLILLPLLLRHLNIKRFVTYILKMVIISVLLFLPFASSQLFTHIFESVELYFQHFEFNASIYYLIRAVGYWVKGYNIIAFSGKMLPIVFVVFMAVYTSRYRPVKWQGFFNATLFFFFIYYLLALVVHPWYLSMLVLFSVLTQYRYAIAWSAVICFTYVTYSYTPYKENLWIAFFEYALVISYAVYEYRNTPVLVDNETDGAHLATGDNSQHIDATTDRR